MVRDMSLWPDLYILDLHGFDLEFHTRAPVVNPISRKSNHRGRREITHYHGRRTEYFSATSVVSDVLLALGRRALGGFLPDGFKALADLFCIRYHGPYGDIFLVHIIGAGGF